MTANATSLRRLVSSTTFPRALQVVLAVLLAVVAGTLTPGTALAAPSVPPGFVVQTMPSGQDEVLTDFVFAPDGSWFTTGKNGRVAWVSREGQARTLAELQVLMDQDLGLTGIAVASDYATSRVIYTARATSVDGQRSLRLSAWTVAGDPEPSALVDERVLWDLPARSGTHALTGLVVAADGTLWVTIGDNSDPVAVDPQALRAQSLDEGVGKLLHVLPDGQGVSSNPFYDPAAPASWRSRVYASGFRSPFRLSLDPATGTPVVGDVGWNGYEEIDFVRPGSNYGWPCWEGETPTPGYSELSGCQAVGNTPPLWTYPHGPLGASVTGGVLYTGTLYPEEYRGAYFFGDFVSQRVYTLRYDAEGRLVRAAEELGFAAENGAPVKFATADNGDVVYADIATSMLRRLVYAPGNSAPTPTAVVTVDADTRTVTFDASGSSDPNGDPVTHRWDFGDGTGATGPQVRHTYAGPDSVTAVLTVTDPLGAAASASYFVAPADHAPVLTLGAPPPDRRYAVGEMVEAAATATDVEDGPLPVTWSVVLEHCGTGGCHDHPGDTFQGDRYAVPFADHGDGVRLHITASSTDSAGVRSEQTFIAEPAVERLTLAASPPQSRTPEHPTRALR